MTSKLQQGSESWQKQSGKYEDRKQKSSSGKKLNILYDVNWFPMTTSPWISSIAFIYFLFHLLHTLNFYFSVYEKVYNQKALFNFTQMISPSIVTLGYVLNILLNILCLISFFFNDLNEEGLKYLIAWLGNKVYPVIRYLIEINLAISAIIFYVDIVSAGFFIVTAIMNLFITFFAQNYILRKDYLCCKNVAFLLLHKITIILGYGVSCVGYRIINDPTQFLIFLGIHLCAALLLFLCYFLFGFNIYRHTTPRVLLIAAIVAYLSLSLSGFYDEANRQYTNGTQIYYIVYQVVLFVIISFFCFSILQAMKRNGVSKQEKDFKKKIFFIFNMLQSASQSPDDDCIIRGILRHHIKNSCQNSNCFINRNKPIYDSKKNKQCFLDKVNQGKTSLTKFYLKCLYEQKLNEQKWNSTQLILDYIEFFYMKLKNIFKVTHLITNLEAKYLTPFQRLRLERIKKTMREQNDKLNNQLFLSQLDIENIINAENKFQQIKGQISEFLKRNLVFWKYVQKDSVDLSEMSSIVQPNFKLIESINNNWKQLAKYFEVQKRWKFYYVCYTLYVKNEKVKPQFIQYFGTNVHQQELFSQQCAHIDKTTQQQKLFNAKMLFESNSCFIHISSHHEKSIIKKVSKYFTRMFKYQQAEILQSPIEILMTSSIRKIHHSRFLQWAGEGKSNNESTYEVKKIFPVAKSGYIIPVYKFYKQVLYLQRMTNEYELQYIAMLKRNKQDQFVAILNQNFQIQAFTQSLSRRMKLKDEQYSSMKKLNILSLCPSVLKYTKFEGEILKDDEDFKRDDNKKGSMSHQMSNPNPDKERKFSRVLETKKEMTESNCKLLIPTDVRQCEQMYRKGIEKSLSSNNNNNNPNEQQLKPIYSGIRQAYYLLKKSRLYRKYKAQIQIKQRTLSTSQGSIVYYEVYFRDIQQTTLTQHISNGNGNIISGNNFSSSNNQQLIGGSSNRLQAMSSSSKRDRKDTKQNNQQLLQIKNDDDDSNIQQNTIPYNNLNNQNNLNNLNNNPNNQKNNLNNNLNNNIFQQQQHLDNIQKQQQQDEILQEDFHLFFESNSNSQSISIAFGNNIFIKEDNNKPVQMISHVGSITITVRIFFVMFMSIVITAFLLENVNSTDIFQRGTKLKYLSQFQLKMYLTHNAIFGTINNVENLQWAQYQIQTQSTQLIRMKQQYNLKKLILDDSINKFTIYQPAQFTSEFDTPTYDQIDLIDLLIEKIVTFKYLNASAILRDNAEFRTLKNYLLPSFNNLANKTKIQLNNGFQSYFKQTQIMTIVLYIIQTILLFLGFFVVLTRLIKISNSFISLMEIFTQLSQTDVKKTWRYSQYTMKLFLHLNEKDQQMSEKQQGLKQVHSLQNNTSLRADQHYQQEVENANLNKKVKKVQIGQQLTKIKLKSIIFIIIFLVVYGLSSFAFNIFMSRSQANISQFKQKGYNQLFRYIPNLEIAVMAMHDKYDDFTGYNNSLYTDIFSNLQQMKEINTVFDITTQFDKQYKMVFFDDFCLLHTNLFTRDQVYSQCRTLAQNTLQHGVQSFLYYLYSDVTNIIQPAKSVIPQSSLRDDHLAVKIIDYYLLDLMNVWQGQFGDKINTYKNLILIVSICLILFHILVYIILVEIFIVGNMKEKYEIFKTIYLNYMPDFVVSKQKIIKAKLHVEGFLQK